jgi:hypothetical protein
MKAFLHVASGSLAGRRVSLRPDKPLRVGRGARADVVVASDDKMAPLHFELAWDGASCALRDMGRHGTSLDGKIVADGAVRDGGLINAGTTSFLVRLLPDDPRARMPPPPARWRPPTPEIQAVRAAALAELRAEKGLFAILDAARDRRILALLRASEEDSRSLFDGAKGDLLAPAAPYLVKLGADSVLLKAVVEEGWGDAWGVYLTSQRPLDEVRRRLRRSLMVNDEETGKRLYFRFYDPRVLSLFWPSANPRQKSEMMGTEIGSFLLEGPDATVMRLGKEG